MGINVCLLFLFALESISESAAFNLIMENSYQQVPSKQTFTVLCQADVPLTTCQFKRYYNLNIFFDLSRGSETPPMAAVSYAGAGLESGQCGITISKQSLAGGYNVYGCRARSGGGGWKHGVAVVDVSDGTYWTLPVVSGPGTVLADAGSNVTISFSTGGTLNFCNFKWPGWGNWTRAGEDSTFSIDNSELEDGKCRLTLFNVSADTSGFILTDIRSKYRIKGKRGDHIRVTTLVVKAAPSLPVLTFSAPDAAVNATDVAVNGTDAAVNETDVAVPTDLLDATCSVGLARPVARISWLLGDDVIRNDLYDDTDSGSVWSWEFEARTMTQNLRRKLTAADDGKELICRVEHIALPGGRAEVRKTISVRGPRLVSLPSHVAWLLIGVGASLLGVVAILLTSWVVYTCSTRRRDRGSDKGRVSPIYDDVDLNLSNGYDSNGVRNSKIYFELDEPMPNASGWQERSN